MVNICLSSAISQMTSLRWLVTVTGFTMRVQVTNHVEKKPLLESLVGMVVPDYQPDDTVADMECAINRGVCSFLQM